MHVMSAVVAERARHRELRCAFDPHAAPVKLCRSVFGWYARKSGWKSPALTLTGQKGRWSIPSLLRASSEYCIFMVR